MDYKGLLTAIAFEDGGDGGGGGGGGTPEQTVVLWGDGFTRMGARSSGNTPADFSSFLGDKKIYEKAKAIRFKIAWTRGEGDVVYLWQENDTQAMSSTNTSGGSTWTSGTNARFVFGPYGVNGKMVNLAYNPVTKRMQGPSEDAESSAILDVVQIVAVLKEE